MPEIESLNRLTDHMFFCKFCFIKARSLAKNCQYIAGLFASLSFDKETAEMLKEIMSNQQYHAFQEIKRLVGENAKLVKEIQVCEGQENRFDGKIMRRNFLLNPLKNIIHKNS